MSLSTPFIRRPIATSLLMLTFLLSGWLAYHFLSISALPQVDYPTIQVSVFYPGASPDVMASSVTAPLERQFGQMPGLNEMTSTSSSGAVAITLQFSLQMTLDVAEQEVQQAINAAATYLPSDLPNPPIYSKVNPADTPIITLALTSRIIPLPQVEDYADTRLAQKISQLPGVGLVSISGGQRPAVRVQANPNALAAYGLTLEDLRSALATGNVNIPKGNFDGPHQSYIINSNDQLLSASAYRPLIVAFKNGAPVRVSDVAVVKDDVENVKQAAWINNTPAILLNIQRQPGANVIQVADRIKELLPQLQAALPNSIHVTLLSDRTITIRHSVVEAKYALLLSVALVVMVIFIFLRNFPATIIPSISVPVSLIGTFALMYVLGFSINNLTLMALTIATGFVVDDAIVMIENISRFLEQGESPMQAALRGSKQIGFTIMSLTFSLIAVLIPLLLMSDVIGRLFREFAVTLAVAILISGIVSLTLTPMLCSRLLRSYREDRTNRWQRLGARLQARLIHYYGETLRWVLQRRGMVLRIATFILFFTLLLLYLIPKGFIPLQDTGVIQGISVAPQSISFPAMVQRQQALANIVLQDPAVDSIASFIGIDGTNPTLNSGRLNIILKPLSQRVDRANTIIKRLQQQLVHVPGIQLYLQPVQDFTVDNRVSRSQYQYSISSPQVDEVIQWTDHLVEQLKQLPQLTDVTSDQQNLGLKTLITIDRDTASRLGVNVRTVDDTLYDAFGQRQVSIMFTQLNQYHVVLEILPTLQLGSHRLDNIYVTAGNLQSSVIPSGLQSSSVPAVGSSVPNVFASATTNRVYTAPSVNNSNAPTNPVNVTTPGGAANAGSTDVPPAQNSAVPLSAFTRITQGITPLLITRQNQFPVATLSFNLAPGVTLGEGMRAINAVVNQMQQQGIPKQIQTRYEGAAQAFERVLTHETMLLVAAIIVVYIVLGVLYESYIHPITIISTLPSACMGALLALWLTGKNLTMIALIGIILLIGIVMKNAILMIDFALELERTQGKSPYDAIYTACLLRFRPILMTTMAAMLGAVPLALSGGMGAELRQPLGIAIIAGLAVSQVLTLYSTPVIYLGFDALEKRMIAWRRRWLGDSLG